MAKFKVGDKVRAKDPAWPGYQGHALGHDVYVVKKVDWDGTVKLDGFIDVWVSPGSLVSANAACNAKWVIQYRGGGKEKVDAPTHDAAKKVADERSRVHAPLLGAEGSIRRQVMESKNPIVRNAVAAHSAVANAEAYQKLHAAWFDAFRAIKNMHDMASAGKHQAVMDAANAAAKTLSDKTRR